MRGKRRDRGEGIRQTGNGRGDKDRRGGGGGAGERSVPVVSPVGPLTLGETASLTERRWGKMGLPMGQPLERDAQL